MKNYFKLFTALLFFGMFNTVAAQTPEGFPKSGTQGNFKVIKCSPSTWANESNQFNVYVETEKEIHLYTFLNGKKGDFSKITNCSSIAFDESFFMLHNDRDENYYFTTDLEKAQEATQMVKYAYPATATYTGNGVAHHTWTKGTKGKPTFDQLKSAKSIYDVM